jgi:hypothetical protein
MNRFRVFLDIWNTLLCHSLAFRDYASDFLDFASKQLLLFRAVLALFCYTIYLYNLPLMK